MPTFTPSFVTICAELLPNCLPNQYEGKEGRNEAQLVLLEVGVMLEVDRHGTSRFVGKIENASMGSSLTATTATGNGSHQSAPNPSENATFKSSGKIRPTGGNSSLYSLVMMAASSSGQQQGRRCTGSNTSPHWICPLAAFESSIVSEWCQPLCNSGHPMAAPTNGVEEDDDAGRWQWHIQQRRPQNGGWQWPSGRPAIMASPLLSTACSGRQLQSAAAMASFTGNGTAAMTDTDLHRIFLKNATSNSFKQWVPSPSQEKHDGFLYQIQNGEDKRV
ncbi:hypothetical protein ACLOJK_007327 [Asimina triloba]